MAKRARETLESLKYTAGTPGNLSVLDQRKLPFETIYDDIDTTEDVWTAIQQMRVRGAPAIAICAAIGTAVATQKKLVQEPKSLDATGQVKDFLIKSLDYVVTSRPTAVNLSNVVSFMKKEVETESQSATDGPELIHRFVTLAERIYAEDVSFNEGIMRNGAAHILGTAAGDAKVNVVTICNTGALATSRYGTALGVVRQLDYDEKLEQLYACETRPWNQGARLTVYECVQESIPVTLICDSAVSSLMASHKIHAVVVGADRVCKNGDTANKIGTYNVAVAAKYHNVPFYVAAPTTTLDPKTTDGSHVKIEERETTEITHNMATKQRVVADGETLKIWNPVFDITPAALITGGIITEKKVLTPEARPNGLLFDVEEVC